MIPRHIFNQPIGNHPSETWLREIADMEHENGEATACVFQAAPLATVTHVQVDTGTRRETAQDATDGRFAA